MRSLEILRGYLVVVRLLGAFVPWQFIQLVRAYAVVTVQVPWSTTVVHPVGSELSSDGRCSTKTV